MEKAQAYFNNMELSQERTRNVLEFCLRLLDSPAERTWTKQFVTANGLSSSQLIISEGAEDFEASRRVEFRTRTSAEQQLVSIISEFPDDENSIRSDENNK